METNKEQELAEIRKRLKELLVINLNLEDIKPEQIKDDEILFGEGLGLDSLDAVEIVVLLQRNFNLDVKKVQSEKKPSITSSWKSIVRQGGMPESYFPYNEVTELEAA